MAPLVAGVVSYMGDALSAANPRGYRYETPLVLGASFVGRVLAAPADAPSLRPGRLAWVNPLVRARDGSGDEVLQGFGLRGDVSDGARALPASE